MDMAGVGCGIIPGGGGEVATVELFCFLCHCKQDNYAYTFAAGCMQKCLIVFKSLEFVCTPYWCLWIENVYKYYNKH